jgi:hypothetical protein
LRLRKLRPNHLDSGGALLRVAESADRRDRSHKRAEKPAGFSSRIVVV